MLPNLITDPRYYHDKVLSEEEILGWFNEVCDAAWMHDDSPESPHAESPYNGKCIGGFFDCSKVLCYPNLCEIFGFQLVRKLKEAGIEKVDYVIGSSCAGIAFSHEVAKGFDAVHAFTEKDTRIIPTDPKRKGMLWQGTQIPKDATVLQVEELIAVPDNFRATRKAVQIGNYNQVNFLSVVGALVHCPPELPISYDGIEVVSLVEVEVWAVDPPCRFCKVGSPRYLPEGNWKKLTGKA